MLEIEKDGNQMDFHPSQLPNKYNVCKMECIKAYSYRYRILRESKSKCTPYPWFRNDHGTHCMWVVTPQHGRSYLIGRKNNKRYVISKGNGLSYSPIPIVTTDDQENEILGLLLKNRALRDFDIGNEVTSLGVLTNQMEYVLELEDEITVRGKRIRPTLLQYSVQSPYRISDAAFIEKEHYMPFVENWANNFGFDSDLAFHLMAAEVLFSNLKILHANGILHNAITSQNYTWALELLDFELSYSPFHPYEVESYNAYVPRLFSREIIETYQVVLDIGGILRERIDHTRLMKVVKKYGFDI